MDVNLKIKIPALEQLLKMTASGIGAVAGPMLARWQSRAQADSLRIEAEGKADAIGLIASAQSEARGSLAIPPSSVQAELDIHKEIHARLSFQEEKRQRNIVSVVRRAAEELGEKKVQSEEVDHDWTAEFFNNAQDVSTEEMQLIWAKILAGEVEHPGDTSTKTLSILKTMSQEIAILFKKSTQFVVFDFILNHREITDKVPEFLSYDELQMLSEHSLFNVGFGYGKKGENKNTYLLSDHEVAFSFYREDRKKFDLHIPAYNLTQSGRELYRIVRQDTSGDYLRELARFLYRQDKVKIAYANLKIGGRQLSSGPFIEIDPDV